MLSWLRPCAGSMSVVIASDQTSTPQERANTRDECGSATLVKLIGKGSGASRANWFPSLNKRHQNMLADKGESSAANIGPVHS